MMPNSIGDGARAFALQNASHRLKTTMDVLSQELTSGRTADLGQRVQGNLQPVHHLESRLRLLREFGQAASEAATQADTIQVVLGSLQATSLRISTDQLAATSAATPQLAAMQSQDAMAALESVVSRLNGSAGGMFVFSGVETDISPLIDATELMAELTRITSGLATPSDVENALSDWFSAAAGGAGYLDFAYRGSEGQARQVQLSENGTTSLDIDASAPEIRNLLKGLALGALASRGGVSDTLEDQRDLLRRSGRILMDNQPGIVALAAKTGLVQQRIEEAKTTNAAERASYEIARNNIVSADPFATATALSEVQSQIEMLHSLTARLSRLKLTDFLR